MKRLLCLLLLLTVAAPAHAFVWSSAAERALERLMTSGGTLLIPTLAASNTYTGTPQVAPVWQATTKFLAADGTVAAPSIAFTSQTNTGIYRAAANEIDFATNGVRSFTFKSNDMYLLGSATPRIYMGTLSDAILTRFAAANLQLGDVASATPVAQILSAQNGVGTDIATTTLTIKAPLSTGAGAPGTIVLSASAAALGTGTTLQTAVEHLTVGGNAVTAVVPVTVSGTAPSVSLTDTTASAKSLTAIVDANIAQLRETAGASGSLLNLDLTNNRLGLGTTAPSHVAEVANNSGNTGIAASNYGVNSNGAQLILRKSRHGTIGSHTIVNNNDVVGQYAFGASNGNGYDNPAYIQAVIDGTPGGSNDMPTRLEFYNAPDASSTAVLNLVIKATGQVLVTALKTTGSATGKTVVCVDVATGQLYASTSGVACAN